jgi:hypothetical protein
VAGLNMPQYVQAAAIRHVNVEQHEIPLLFPQQVQSLVAAGSLPHGIDARVGFEELLESGSDNRMIIRDQYS